VSTPIRIVRLLWMAGFLIGTTTHVVDLVLGGAEVYAGFPDGARLFWVSLTLLDPVIVLLIGLRRRAGIVLGVVVMIADVAVNAAIPGGATPSGLVALAVFGAFVLLTAYPLWRAFSSPTRPPRRA
jgi:hypothetical protein